MSNLSIDRARLVEYIKENAEHLIMNADVDVDTATVIVNENEMHFATMVRVNIEGIPISEVEVTK